MYQIDNSTAAAVIPASSAPGTAGFFTDGNPATGITPTIVPAEYLNMLMMEMLNVIIAAGVTPSKSTFTQLTTSIKALAKQSTILADTGTAGVYAAANTPALTALPATGFAQRVNIAHLNPGASTYAPDGLAAKPIYGLGLQPLQGGELPAGIAVLMYLIQAGVNGGNGAWIIVDSFGGAEQIPAATQSQHAMQFGQFAAQAIATGLIRTVKRQLFTSNGTYTPSTGMVFADVEGVAGGGGGGGATGGAGTSSTGGGGGEGGYFRKVLTAAQIGASQAVTIGASGAAGLAGPNTGGSGGTTSLGALLSAAGAAGGSGGSAGAVVAISGSGGAGGTATGGDVNIQGSRGFPGTLLGGTNGGLSGQGANSPFGRGGNATGPTGTGTNATGFGAGGSGGATTSSSITGGTGSGGYMVITEYCAQ